MKHYLSGYLLSVFLTALAFGLVALHAASGHVVFAHPFLAAALVAIAAVQLVVQMVFFLRLGARGSRRWNLALFIFMALIVAIIVGGSLWIMANLNYNMTPAQMNEYMINQSE